jgi:hypothetical protein
MAHSDLLKHQTSSTSSQSPKLNLKTSILQQQIKLDKDDYKAAEEG